MEVVRSGISAETDSTGAFRLPSVPPGVVSLRASAVSYLPVVQTDVVVGATRPATVLLALSSAPLAMSEITVGPSCFATPQETPTSTQRLNAEEKRREGLGDAARCSATAYLRRAGLSAEPLNLTPRGARAPDQCG